MAATLVGVAALGLLVLFSDTAVSVVRKWSDSLTFTHGFLIVPIVGYLVWRVRENVARLAPEPNLWGLVAIAAAAFGWLIGNVAGVLVVQQFALVALLQAMVFTVLGRRVARALAFPLAYLYFAVPAGEFLVPPLQDFTAVFTVKVLRLIGVPVFLDGIFISIPTGNFEVAEACAGVRFLIAMVALGCLYSYLTYHTWIRRLAFIALSMAVPIIANGFRAFGIVYIAYLTDNRVAVSVDHIVYGWVFFTAVMMALLALGMLFRERDAVPDADAPPARTVTGGSTIRSARAFVTAAAAVMLVAGAAPVYALYIDSQPAAALGGAELPAVSPPWTAASEEGRWRPVFPGADRVLTRTYVSDDRRASLAIAYFSRQTEGAEVIGDLNDLAGGTSWKRAGGGRRDAVIDGQALRVAYTRYLASDGDRIVWYWYWVDGAFTGGAYVAKALEARAKLLGGVQAAAVIAVTAPYNDRPSEADASIESLLASLAPIGKALERMAGR
ncbi:MAG: exosortase A [Alphaproteobacteria bacterium]